MALNDIYERIFRDDCVVCFSQEEGTLSYPLPGMTGDRRVERFFVMPSHVQPIKYRPFAMLTVDPCQGDVLSFARCEVNDFAEALNMPLDTDVDYSAPVELNYREVARLRGEYAALYREVRAFVFEPELTSGQTRQLRQMLALQDSLFRPTLKDFYRCLSPEFYTWAEAILGIPEQYTE